ncbi:Tripartite DNA replication factor [Gryganskiella cystojenkinii]|nr:Tripartite DNA replication factor [Gryganskiella cystojenkinii]
MSDTPRVEPRPRQDQDPLDQSFEVSFAALNITSTHQQGEDNASQQSIEYSFASLDISEEDWALIDQADQALPPQSTSSSSTTRTSFVPVPVFDWSTLPPPKPRTSVAKPETQKKFKFSPSVLAHHANTACEKMLHLKGEQLWQQSNIPMTITTATTNDAAVTEPETVDEATMTRGVVFEDQLQSSIPNRVDCHKEGDKDSLFRLSTEPDGTTLCQAVFSLGADFYTPAMTKAGIVFGRFLPDFIRILPGTVQPNGTRKKRLFIIDAKSSSHVKISHQFQVTLYAIFLEHLIRVNKQDHLVEIDLNGGVWLPNHAEPKTFSLAFMQPIVENFLFQELPSILSKPRVEAIWHIDSPCYQCEFLPKCKQEAQEQMTLSLIPMLSKRSALWIKTLFKAPSKNSSEIADLEDLIRNHDHISETSKKILGNVLKLNHRGESILFSSYRQKAVKVIPSRTMDLPRLYQKRLLINLAIDPLTLLPFAYSLDAFKDNQLDAYHSVADLIEYSRHDSKERENDHGILTLNFIDTLYEWLVYVSEIPRSPVLSVFVYSQSTSSDLYKLLLKVIMSSPDHSHWAQATKDRALSILVNLYQDPSFLTLTGGGSETETTHSKTQLPDLLQLTQGFKNWSPVFDKRLFCIESAIRSMLVFPVMGYPTFKDVMVYLVDEESPEIIDPEERDDEGFQISEIYQTWRFGRRTAQEFKKGFTNWAKQQSLLLVSLYGILRREGGDLTSFLLATQAPFKLRPQLKIESNILAQFAFFLQWEAITQAEQLRVMRISTSREESFHKMYSLQGRFLGRHVGPLPGASAYSRVSTTPLTSPTSAYYGKFVITSRINVGVFDSGLDFPGWLLSPDTAEGEKARMRFDDVNAMLRPFGRGIPCIASVSYFDPETNIVLVKGTYQNMTESIGLTVGESYILEKRTYNPTLTISMDKLVEMNTNCRLFLKLMADPNKWGQKNPKDFQDFYIESIASPARIYDFTFSQDLAFSRVVTNRLQVIWGPPGSGKTHFLALTVLRVVDILNSLARKGKGQGIQTIVLTAFTHAAINNLAARVANLHKLIAPRPESEDVVGQLNLYRLRSSASVEIEGVQLLEVRDLKKQTASTSNDVVRIICGTVWQIRRASNPTTGAEYMQNVQMLMIDEGSQLLSAEAAHAIECLDPNQGRLIVAGDHLQLGPIISGAYPVSENTIDPTGSIMRNLMRKKDNTPVSLKWVKGEPVDVGPCTWQLQDNFRMNQQLGSFMQLIYGSNYRVRNPDKTLPYSGQFLGASYPADLRHVLDPERSAIAIELQLAENSTGRNMTKVQSDSRAAAYLEAAMVDGIVKSYLEMVGPQTASSVFVAVPHHIQRQAIQSRISLPTLEEQYPLIQIKVDTIEKMQGQEADLVVVCFALFDESQLMGEIEYLYSVHRWVVALSRARCKTVLLMTPQLRSPKLVSGTGTNKARASSLGSLDGWGLLQAFEKYAQSHDGKFVWPVSETLLREIGMDSFS